MAQYDPTLGPFLPFSPIDAAFLRPSNNANDQSESQGRSLSISSASTPSQLPIPRHISASAYPPTPLSVDPHNLQRDGVWTDRQASFAAAAVGETVHTAAEDTLWEEGMAEGTGVKGEEGQSGNPRLAALGMMSVRRARTVGGSFGEAAGDVAE